METRRGHGDLGVLAFSYDQHGQDGRATGWVDEIVRRFYYNQPLRRW